MTDSGAFHILRSSEVDLNLLRSALEKQVEESSGSQRYELEYLIRFAEHEAAIAGDSAIRPVHLLISLLTLRRGFLAEFLFEHGQSKESLRIAQRSRKPAMNPQSVPHCDASISRVSRVRVPKSREAKRIVNLALSYTQAGPSAGNADSISRALMASDDDDEISDLFKKIGIDQANTKWLRAQRRCD